ncbi:tetratricopeptide repeat protein [Gemmata sp. G18]|uniref:Tetratricopeptide repeat protein n=1 Tax=Gemmata palustris TaxID=2822762 RepID=A0ABS5BW44_9BACT|nr:tetratricopeptide repeat protein [Gemmata palustris]MBP3957951.1 tetratricopeptide repeat protein [Gemmata palustris]
MLRQFLRAALGAALILPIAACSGSVESSTPSQAVSEPPLDPAQVAKENEYREQVEAGQKALDAKNTDAAIAHFEKAVAAKEKGFEAQLALGRAYAAKKNDEKAIKTYGVAQAANPRASETYLERAVLLERAGRLEAARTEYTQLIGQELEPGLTAKAYWLRSDLADRLGKRTDYRFDREQAMKLEPDFAAKVKGGDVLVVNNSGSSFALKVEQYEAPDGAECVLPKGYQFQVSGNTSVYLTYQGKPVTARSIRFTIMANEKSRQYTMTYAKGMSLEVPINEADVPR